MDQPGGNKEVTVEMPDLPAVNTAEDTAPLPKQHSGWSYALSVSGVMTVLRFGHETPTWFVLSVLLLVSGLLARPLARLAGKLRSG